MSSVFIWQKPAASQSKPTALSCTAEHITPREAEILMLLAEGKLNKEIALRLNISLQTVKAHLRNVYKKTGAQNKIEALNKTRQFLPFAAAR